MYLILYRIYHTLNWKIHESGYRLLTVGLPVLVLPHHLCPTDLYLAQSFSFDHVSSFVQATMASNHHFLPRRNANPHPVHMRRIPVLHRHQLFCILLQRRLKFALNHMKDFRVPTLLLRKTCGMYGLCANKRGKHYWKNCHVRRAVRSGEIVYIAVVCGNYAIRSTYCEPKVFCNNLNNFHFIGGIGE